MKPGDIVLWQGVNDDQRNTLWNAEIKLTHVYAGIYRGVIVTSRSSHFTPGHEIRGEVHNLVPLTNKIASWSLYR